MDLQPRSHGYRRTSSWRLPPAASEDNAPCRARICVAENLRITVRAVGRTLVARVLRTAQQLSAFELECARVSVVFLGGKKTPWQTSRWSSSRSRAASCQSIEGRFLDCPDRNDHASQRQLGWATEEASCAWYASLRGLQANKVRYAAYRHSSSSSSTEKRLDQMIASLAQASSSRCRDS